MKSRFRSFAGNARKAAVAVAVVLPFASAAAFAADSAVQDVEITVEEVNEITVGSTVSLSLTSASAGNPLTGTSSSTYAITSNSASGKKITAQLTEALGAGLGLKVTLEAPSGATSAGQVTLGNVSAVDVVTGIAGVAEDSLSIDYAATATTAVEPDTYAAEVTYTIVNDT